MTMHDKHAFCLKHQERKQQVLSTDVYVCVSCRAGCPAVLKPLPDTGEGILTTKELHKVFYDLNDGHVKPLTDDVLVDYDPPFSPPTIPLTFYTQSQLDAAVQAVVEKAALDTKRLDWFESYVRRHRLSVDGTPARGLVEHPSWYVRINGIYPTTRNHSIRDAFDEAMATFPPPGSTESPTSNRFSELPQEKP